MVIEIHLKPTPDTLSIDPEVPFQQTARPTMAELVETNAAGPIAAEATEDFTYSPETPTESTASNTTALQHQCT